ncbi:MAG: glycosyl hydrolase [bacterium]
MKRLILLFAFSVILINSTYAQVNGYVEDFNDGNIDDFVADHERTFQLSAEDGALKINYTRTASSDPWDNFNYTPPQTINIGGTRLITVKVKSSVNASISFKPVFEVGDQYMSKDLTGDNEWCVVTFQVDVRTNYNMIKMYMYLDGGSTQTKSGVVCFDEIRFGDSAFVVADFTMLDRAIINTGLLIANSTEGISEGEYPAGSIAVLQNELDEAVAIRNSGTGSQTVADEALWNLIDACVDFEKSVNAVIVNIIDPSATKETRYLYLNLKDLQNRFILFGMHDATGYGVGWSGDNDRSDVNDVVGDFPAVFSEDMNGPDSDPNNSGAIYRLSTAYNENSVVTMCWHQLDPQGRGFYSSDVNNENIVSTILPGGTYHEFYKNKLKTVAVFLKGLRGSKGESVPVIFRPYHEHTGDWFWWGDGQCTINQYNSLWQFTVNYLRDSLNVHNLLYAISPSYIGVYQIADYTKIFPGDDYIDLIGGDFYFSSPAPENEINNFKTFSRILGTHTVAKGKVGAVTEVGQEGLKNNDWFTKYLLAPLKNDTVTSNLVYAAVWRNASTTHHYAPYPGHSSVPDFMTFYNDPYTMFRHDLPLMYRLPVADTQPPIFTSLHDTTIIASTIPAKIIVATDERAFLRYSETNETYYEMENQFTLGEGSFIHTAYVNGNQGEIKTIYVHAMDLYGNQTAAALPISFTIDTLQAPVPWFDPRYPVNTWASGATPIGTGASAVTNSSNAKTIYFRKTINLEDIPTAMGFTVKSVGGAEITVNGYPAGRINLPPTEELNYNTDPTSTAEFTKVFILDANALATLNPGENIFTVEVHTTSGNTITSFDAQILNQDYQTIMPFGGEWLFYDLGDRPADIKLGDIAGVASSELPVDFVLYQNYPNPFNPTTVISYQLPIPSKVQLKVYDVLGREVASIVNDEQHAGFYKRRFDANGLSSGVYFYRLKANDLSITKKFVLMK